MWIGVEVTLVRWDLKRYDDTNRHTKCDSMSFLLYENRKV